MRLAPGVAFAASLFFAPIASADVYTYVDAKGRVNVSNVEPPEGARVTSVVRSKPAKAPDAADEARRAAEVTRLARRVKELEDEMEAQRRAASEPPAPPVVYPVFAPAPAPASVTAQAIVNYVASTPPAPDYGCVPSWAGCALWWSSPVVVIGSPTIPRHNRFNDRRVHARPLNHGFMTRPPPLFPPSLRATPP